MSPARKRRGRTPGSAAPDPQPAETIVLPGGASAEDAAAFAYDDPDHGQIGRGGTGSLPGIPDCPVCFAQGGGGHGGGCPNAGQDPGDWVTGPPDGWSGPQAQPGYG